MSDSQQTWGRVKAIASDAWALPAIDRAGFVAQLCAEDDALRSEVLSLLAHMDQAGDRSETPALAAAGAERAARLAIGAHSLTANGGRLGPWRIVRELGYGGMGGALFCGRG